MTGARGSRRWLRRLAWCAVAAAVGVVALAAGLVWWPLGSRAVDCDATNPRCVVIRGRVIYALQKDRADSSRPLHLVLASRESLSAPGVSVVKIPVELRPARAPGFATLVEVVGDKHRGSNGEMSVTAQRVAFSGKERPYRRPGSVRPIS